MKRKACLEKSNYETKHVTCIYIPTHINTHPPEIAVMGDTQTLGTMSAMPGAMYYRTLENNSTEQVGRKQQWPTKVGKGR